MIVLIGEKWLAITNKKGTRRLDNPDDYVRMECRIGLQRNILLIPATIEHATLPGRDELPSDIAKLIEQNAAVIRYERFTADVDALIEMIEKTVARVGDSKGLKRKPAFSWTGALGEVLSAFAEARTQRGGAQKPQIEGIPGSLSTPSLARIIPGVWQIHLTYPNGMRGQTTANFTSSGSFRAEGRSQMGMFTIDGNWSVDSPEQVSLRGRQSDGHQLLPFNAVIAFSSIGEHRLAGILNTGEQTLWQRLR
jgi:hypothetical protein